MFVHTDSSLPSWGPHQGVRAGVMGQFENEIYINITQRNRSEGTKVCRSITKDRSSMERTTTSGLVDD